MDPSRIRRRGSWAVAALWCQIAVSVLSAISNVYAVGRISDLLDRGTTLVRVDEVPRLAAFQFLGIFSIAGYVIWLVWQHGCQRALRSTGLQLRFTPGWVVGWWFVPFMNLVRPYQVVREQCEAGPAVPAVRRTFLAWWWGCWLAPLLIIPVGLLSLLRSYRLIETPGESPPFVIMTELAPQRTLAIVGILGACGLVAAAGLAIVITRAITRRTVELVEASVPLRPDLG